VPVSALMTGNNKYFIYYEYIYRIIYIPLKWVIVWF